MIYSPCHPLIKPWSTRTLHALDLLLKGPQLVSIVTIHTKTVSKQSILTQRDELQRRVDKWGWDNPQAVFIACSNSVFNFFIDLDEKPRTEYAQCLGASAIGSISNTWDPEHWKGCRGKTEEQRSSHSPSSKNRKWGPMHALPLQYTMHTNTRIVTWANMGS